MIGGKHMHIAICDDNVADRKHLERLLSRESAKRAGKSVQEHAKDVVNNPKATKLQKKRA